MNPKDEDANQPKTHVRGGGEGKWTAVKVGIKNLL